MKKMFKIAAVISIAGLSLAGCSSSGSDDGGDDAEGYKACLVSDAGGWDDKSFNESAKDGLDKAVADLSVKDATAESKDATDFEANVQSMVDQDCDLIIGVGFSLGDAIGKAAVENPDIKFALIDSEFSEDTAGDNTKALVFNTQESAYLAGYAAAAMSKTGKVGTFGGMNIPSVSIFMDGFVDGVAKYNEDEGKNVEVLGWDKDKQEGQFADTFDDQQVGTQIAESMIQQGADVIMPVAGPVGFGAAAVARENGEVMIIGVDTDWFVSSEYGDVTLTSVQKSIENAVYDTIEAASKGNFSNENYVGTMANGGLDLAPFHDFESKLPEGLADKIAELKGQIADGTITVDSPSAFPVK
ncbi:MAG: BMP family ABC transporter substrate-binding protein [Actinomycetaceae bacterium]|nr:BMP family ABC transporter substrate-binding protein [Actinomycetaceae bacterium]